jgi:beta-N-acetylglucosaminidase
MEVNIISGKATKFLLFAVLFASFIFLNSNKVLANDPLPSIGYIDVPTYGSTIKGEINVSGWFLDGSGVSKIEVMVDGKGMGEAQYGNPRVDVNKAFPSYQNENSGYKFALDTKKLTNGQHSLLVRETGKNGTTKDLDRLLVNVQNLPVIGSLDTPSNGSSIKDEIDVHGWFLDVSGISKVEVLVDGKSMGEAKYGIDRPDVKKAFSNYQIANSGYQLTLNTKNLPNGQHAIKIRETSNNGATKDLDSIMVDVQNLLVIGSLDTPSYGSTIKDEIDVHGWFLDVSGISKVEVLVDGKSMGEAQIGIDRPDVKKAFSNYQIANSGYQFPLNTKNLPNGQHSITVRETGITGFKKDLDSVQVNVQNLPVVGSLDTPSNGSTINGEIDVHGWFLDLSGVSRIEVLIDGKSIGQAQIGIDRPDVKKAFPKYQISNSGYKFTLITKLLMNGQHSLTVREFGENGAVKDLDSIMVNVQSLPVIGSLDTPAFGSTIKDEINVNGWFLDASGVTKIEVLVDGNSMGEARYGIDRPDVKQAFPKYQNANSGYQFSLNTRQLTNGQHFLTVRETGNNGVVKNLDSHLVNVQNLPARGYIDNPTNGSTIKGDTTVRGWYLDVSGVTKIEILVDGNRIGEAQIGITRPDVSQAFPDYQNANSGYQFTLNSTLFADGQHTLAVKETGGNGSTSIISSQLIVGNGNPYKQIDLRKPANITANDIVNFFNRTRPDSPLKDYAQSFIDAQSKYGVSAQYLVAHAIWETGWNGSNLRNYKHNLFGYSAYNVCPFTCGFYFPSGGDSINYEAYIVRKDYLDVTGSYYNGSTLTGMNVRYATDPNWANGVANLMQSIKPFDPVYYSQSGILPGSSVAAPSFGRNIPSGQLNPPDVIINVTIDTYATVNTNGLTFRSIPYVSTSTVIKALSSGTVVKVLGYNTDVKYVPGDATMYPYDNRWYRVLVDGIEGWIYGGGISF